MNNIIKTINRKILYYKQNGLIKDKHYTYFIYDISEMNDEDKTELLKNSKCDINLTNEELIFQTKKGHLKNNIYFISFNEKILERKPKRNVYFSFN